MKVFMHANGFSLSTKLSTFDRDLLVADELDAAEYNIALCEALRHYAEREGDTRRF